MSLVSILLPSLRCSCAIRRAKEFEIAEPNLDYEIIVVSPFPVFSERVVWVEEKEVKGLVAAQITALEHSTGDYIFTWTDDIIPTLGCITEAVNFIQQYEDPFITGFSTYSEDGIDMGGTCNYYGFFNLCYACYSRKTIEVIGGYYDPIYKSGWADPDICLRAWVAGGKVVRWPNTSIIIFEHEPTIGNIQGSELGDHFYINDFRTFIKRWHPILGRGVSEELVLGNFEVLRDSCYYPPVVDFAHYFL